MVRQLFPDRALRDIPGEVRRRLAASPLAARLNPGARVAIGVGSRGITNLATIVRAVVDYWKDAGMQPFLFPAMGSHGAATAEGQAAVLGHYGVTAAAMGCPLISQLDVVPLGSTPEGIQTFMDRNAYQSDGVMLVGRVKWHTDFDSDIESGLYKMAAIGLGKFAGAQKYHAWGLQLGMGHVVRTVGRTVLDSGKILGGLAILEDAYHHTAGLDVVPVELMEIREKENLATVKSWAGRIPLDLDILILDETGKNISGTGMDTKIINRTNTAIYNAWPGAPKIRRIFVRDLSALTYGNAVGIGMVDVATDRLVDRIDWNATRINALTAGNPASIRTPIHFPTDRECLESLIPTIPRFDFEKEAYIGWIRNTLELARLALSENLRPQIEANPLLEITGGPVEMPFGEDGNLVSPFAAQTASAH